MKCEECGHDHNVLNGIEKWFEKEKTTDIRIVGFDYKGYEYKIKRVKIQ